MAATKKTTGRAKTVNIPTGAITWRTFVTFALAIFMGVALGHQWGKTSANREIDEVTIEVQKDVFDAYIEAWQDRPDTGNNDFYERLRKAIP